MHRFKIKTTFERCSQVRSQRGITGREAAATILRRNQMGHIAIEAVPGSLSDHYDPRARAVRLSETVYGNNSLAAIGVAAHESGHAIQHHQRYGLLELRHSIVPVSNFASSASFPILLLGFIMRSPSLILAGIILFSLVVLFHVVTLPVEINASQRAVAELSAAGLVSNDEIPMVKQVLEGAAALTYLAATISAVANLLYYLLIFMGAMTIKGNLHHVKGLNRVRQLQEKKRVSPLWKLCMRSWKKAAMQTWPWNMPLRASTLNWADRHLVTEIVNGTVRMVRHLDWA